MRHLPIAALSIAFISGVFYLAIKKWEDSIRLKEKSALMYYRDIQNIYFPSIFRSRRNKKVFNETAFIEVTIPDNQVMDMPYRIARGRCCCVEKRGKRR